MSKCRAKTVTGCFDLVGRKLLFESFYFIHKFRSDSFNCFVETSVNFAVAFWPFVVLSFKGIKVNQPVIKRLSASKDNID